MTVERTEAEEWEVERNRVAWNLPRDAGPPASKPPNEALAETRQPPDASDEATRDG